MANYLLGIEFQSLGVRETSSTTSPSIPTIALYLDAEGNYHFGTELQKIEQAIEVMIPHLGGNYRHPLLFNVQILPGDRMDAYLASVSSSLSTVHPRIRRTR